MPTADELLSHPRPALQVQPTSGLDFPWAEYHTDQVSGSSSHTFGPDGVTVAMKMLIYWDDLPLALQQLLGYSWRDDGTLTPRGTPWLRRKLPWQHPVWNQLYVKRIAEVRGLRQQGKKKTAVMFRGVQGEMRAGGVPRPGQNVRPNLGPWTDFYLAELTLHFWRPPYYVRSDRAIIDTVTGNPREWLRYVSKSWEMSLNMLSRENSFFQWLPGVKPPDTAKYFTGSVGQAVTHFRVSRTWYQIPEQALFSSIGSERTPEGLPTNMVYTQTAVENPISKFDRALGTRLTTVGTTVVTTIATTCPDSSALLNARGYVYPGGSPIGGCVNAPMNVSGGSGVTQYAVDSSGNWVDNTVASRFFGCRTGTLRFDGVTFEAQPLQLPPDLMWIPRLGVVEALSQQQYNVTFHFDLFDPPRPENACASVLRGHNLMPFAGNSLWYPIISQRGETSVGTEKLTPFHYADFSDLFYIL